MDRKDFIENRIEVVKNIYTLYSYAKSKVAEDREWALQRFKQGKTYVVESFGNTLLFAPSRFVGYKNNTREKHTDNHGDGKATNKRFHELKLYKEITDVFLTKRFGDCRPKETTQMLFYLSYPLSWGETKSLEKFPFQ